MGESYSQSLIFVSKQTSGGDQSLDKCVCLVLKGGKLAGTCIKWSFTTSGEPNQV